MLGSLVMNLPSQINKWCVRLKACQNNVLMFPVTLMFLNVLNAKEKIWLTVGTASYGENDGNL